MNEPLLEQIDDLLEDIYAGKVIPIIGEDLLQVSNEAGGLQLYSYVATKLAERLRLPTENLPTPLTLNAVVCEYLRQPQRWDQEKPLPEDVYSRIPDILRSAPFPLPQPLRDLASIDKFNLFVSLTFDSLFLDALNEVRFGGKSQTLALAYSETPDDLSMPPTPGQPIVYYLFGKASPTPYSYVVSDEDMLEFVRLLQRPLPLRLFSALKDSRLLFIGCRFSDWLARFLLRIAYERRMWEGGRRGRDRLVGSAVDQAGDFVLFLKTFSPRTMIISRPPGEFVATLAARYRERYGGAGMSAAPRPVVAEPSGPAEEGMIFLSYAREDIDAARRLHDFLLANHIKVWFDEKRNKGGDDWRLSEARSIQACSYFIPLVSAASVGRLEGEYRWEWGEAIKRALKRDESIPFIIPVVIDDTTDKAEGVPEGLKKPHWERLPGGTGTPEFAAMMKDRVRDYVRRARRG